MKVEGSAQIARVLQALSERARGQIVRESLREAAEPIRARAASLARRAPGAPDLADHIVISNARRRNQDDAVAIAVGPSREERSDQPGRTFADQGRFLEHGTVNMAAHPFLRPAIETEGQAAAVSVPQAIWRRLTEKLR